MSFILFRLLSNSGSSSQSGNRFTEVGRNDMLFPLDTTNEVEPERLRAPDNIALRSDAYRSPKLQTQHGPVEAEEPPSYAIAITTTVLHPDPTLPIWLDYHLRRVGVVPASDKRKDSRGKLSRLNRTAWALAVYASQ